MMNETFRPPTVREYSTLGMSREQFNNLEPSFKERFVQALANPANKGQLPVTLYEEEAKRWQSDMLRAVVRAHANPTARAISQDEFIPGAGE